ncbi:hypothetical protein PEPCOX59622_01463 [Aedoeadaptatus coxii]|uniref:DUF896 domain-containing protein n=1 Tax=Aedoeadaptatus coxii TaxID=755172 RepID=UPI0017528FC1|nr:DUF896 domain-containing protein [Peptoniphilus coxii]CAC9934167.1 hypothetical protein PEPCOX59622_01463 [Peptoniphilus coxii]
MIDYLPRINELAKLAKERELTPEEMEERDRLRKAFLKEFRKGFREQLLNTKVVDEEGNDITPEKLKKAKEERAKKQED